MDHRFPALHESQEGLGLLTEQDQELAADQSLDLLLRSQMRRDSFVPENVLTVKRLNRIGQLTSYSGEPSCYSEGGF